jgi:hypothetical protein
MRRRSETKVSLKQRLFGLLPIPLGLGVFLSLIWIDEKEDRERWIAEQTLISAETAARAAFFDGATLGEILAHCTDRWRESLAIYQRPQALAFAHQRVDGYFFTGTDSMTWRRFSCTPAEVTPGPRFARALLENLPAEEAPGDDQAQEDAWSMALSRIADSRLESGLVALELVQNPRDGRTFVRRWQGVEESLPSVEPPDAPSFPILIFDPSFSRKGSPPALETIPHFNYVENPQAAMRIIEKALPPGAKISEIQLERGKIFLRVQATTPAFEGKPPAPYGDMSFDEYGTPDSSWWYPREDPTFGCFSGSPLPQVEAELMEKLRSYSSPLVSAWFSCSSAYSDEKTGVWHLVWAH